MYGNGALRAGPECGRRAPVVPVVPPSWRFGSNFVPIDGWGSHGNRAAFESDRARDADLAALGYAVVRFTYRQVREEPIRVAAQLAPVLSRSPRPREPAAA